MDCVWDFGLWADSRLYQKITDLNWEKNEDLWDKLEQRKRTLMNMPRYL